MAAIAIKCSSRTRPTCWAGSCLVLVALLAPVLAYEADPQYIFISSPSSKNIYYSRLPTITELSVHSDDRPAPEAMLLIDGSVNRECAGPLCTTTSEGLAQPEGVAVWHGKDKAVLYVADAAAQAIYAYPITGSEFDPANPLSGSVQAGAQQTVVKGINSVSGLALDGFGNLYFSTIDGTVGMIDAAALNPIQTSTVHTILYSSDTSPTVQSPFSLAADNFNVYWTNQENGQGAGVVIKAFERNATGLAAMYPEYPKPLAKNAPKANGVCIAKNNVFFTGEAQFLYGVKSSGGGVTEVSRSFQSPRSCAYDGENTLYVADKAGAVYSLPANFPTLRPVKSVQKVALVNDPSGIAVFTRAAAYSNKPTDNGFLGLGW